MPAPSRDWVRPALIQAGVFTVLFVVLNLLITDLAGWLLALFSVAMFLIFFGISARGQRRRRG